MRIVGRIFVGLIVIAILGLMAAFTVLWWRPVGVNNLINKQTIQLALKGPELITQLGFIDDTPLDFHSGKLSSYTKKEEDRQLAQLVEFRRQLDAYGPEGLKGQERLTWEIMSWFYDDIIRQSELEYGAIRINQLSGPTVDMPQFLTDIHQVVSEKSAKRYVSRVREFGRVLDETLVRVKDDRANGVIPPDFIIDKSVAVMEAFLEGGIAGNPLITTFKDRLAKIEKITDEKRAALVADAERAVAEEVVPGYEAIIAFMREMRAEATHDAGVWRLPQGDKLYANALKSNTTTDLTADEIFDIGIAEVARLEGEMDVILQSQGIIEGTVAERIDALVKDPAHHFPNTDEGREQMLAYLVELNEGVMKRVPEYFITIPPQPVEIVRVPEYSQDSAPGGYYQPPALDGSRPGRFYINLKDTADNPRWTLPTLLYHEAAPGHHFQLSAGQLVKGVPFFRKIYPFTSYAEGWGLYAERLAVEMGMYAEDPLGDLGRLQAEMFRSVRLVVDTGMHHKRWSREQAIAYMREKTGMTEAEVTREIERYVVLPGQATAYKIGQLALLRMRTEAERELGEKFDLRAFHELILLNGGMPLGILEGNVRAWISEQKAA